MNRLIYTLSFFVFILFVFIFSYKTIVSSYYSFLNTQRVSGRYSIGKGESSSSVINSVLSGINYPYGLKFFIKKSSMFRNGFKYGNYKADNITIMQLFKNIERGYETQIKLVIPEGYNIYDIASAIENVGINSKYNIISTCTNKTFIKELTGEEYETLEGFLAPGTYFFSEQYPAKKIIKKFYVEFKDNLPEDFELKAKKLGLSYYDAIILASIIQKETYSSYESPIVSSVFLNRLNSGMRLQADPTIIYGLFDNYTGVITKDNIKDSSNLYNTYRHNGLTPTPISNPSAVALNAAVNPDNSNYYYFVATSNGTHVFTETYSEHLKHVSKYRASKK